ncbi:MAG: aspartyl protease family protein [Chitinophagaceae bacterium]
MLVVVWLGAGKVKRFMYLDNHSPSWSTKAVLHTDNSFSKSAAFTYRTQTADGRSIKGNVYICDTVSLGNAAFTQVPFYEMDYIDREMGDGVLGIDILSKGVVKVDFRNNLMTFASSIDSIKGIGEASILPSRFTEKSIDIDVGFRNDITKTLSLDLGCNEDIMMPADEFLPIKKNNSGYREDVAVFSTPGSSVKVHNLRVRDTISVGGRSFIAGIASNNVVKEKLMGLNFFRQFDFIVLDYLNSRVYIAKPGLYQ